jgi:hypothetical protein
MRSQAKILLVALVAGALGVVASLATNGPGPLLRSELGQRLLGSLLSGAGAEPPPAGAGATRG